METCFTASQSVEMVVPQQSTPIQHYLRQPQRLVNALAASSQIDQLSNELFRLKMRPLTFMMFSVQPIVDLQVWAEPDGTLHVCSTACELRGINYINQRFALNLAGQLHPIHTGDAACLKGRADLEVRVELPPALQFTPKYILEATGNGLLKSVLLTIKQRLMHHLISDYCKWANSEESMAMPPQSSGLSTNNPIAGC